MNNKLILNDTDIIETYWMRDADVFAIEITTDLKAFNDIEYAKDEAEFTQVAEFGKKWIISNEDGSAKFIEYDRVTAVRIIFDTQPFAEVELVINKDSSVNYKLGVDRF